MNYCSIQDWQMIFAVTTLHLCAVLLFGPPTRLRPNANCCSVTRFRSVCWTRLTPRFERSNLVHGSTAWVDFSNY